METESKYFIPLDEEQKQTLDYSFEIGDDFFESLEDAEIKRGNLSVKLNCKKGTSSFVLHFDIDGTIYIPCDRCLEDMEQPISTEGELTVCFGEDRPVEDEDTIFIPETETGIDVQWNIYEFIALAIPLRHVHPEGQCDKEMASKFASIMVGGEDEDEANGPEDGGDDDGDKPTDPRWDVLKNLKL
ncbi:MAG: DUF177 domain-containing protein [Paludibacteraceae bacterium]|nr:DUF177 domain-containing protein [Paludibacteraceae bacterium]